MFCEKCGKEISEFEKTCPACGENIIQEDEVVVQTATKKSIYASQTSESAPAPARHRKPMSKKTKIGIFVGVVAAVVVVVALVIVVPMLNSINLKNYITYEISGEFENEAIYNGHFSIYADFDIDKIREENDVNEYKGNGFDDPISAYDVTRYCEINKTVKGRSDDSIDNLTKDNIIIVSIDWTDDEKELDKLEQLEENLGVEFWKQDTTFEVKVSDILAQNDCTVVEPIPFDFFTAAKNLFKYEGPNGEIEFKICNSKPTPFSSYTWIYQADYRQIIFSDASREVGRVNVDTSSNSNLSYGDLVTISLDSVKVGKTNIFLTETSMDVEITR